MSAVSHPPDLGREASPQTDPNRPHRKRKGAGQMPKKPRDSNGLNCTTKPFTEMELFGRLLRWRAARRHAPHLVGEPFEPLLRVVDLRGGHLLGTPGDLPRVGEQIVQHLAQRPVAAPLRLGPRTHAVWIPSARSSALRNSSAAARSVEAMPRSARKVSTRRRPR